MTVAAPDPQAGWTVTTPANWVRRQVERFVSFGTKIVNGVWRSRLQIADPSTSMNYLMYHAIKPPLDTVPFDIF